VAWEPAHRFPTPHCRTGLRQSSDEFAACAVKAADAVALLVAELSSNAVLHGRVPGRDFELRLTYDRAVGLVRVEVSDTHPGQPKPPESSPAPETADGGRGLLLVDAVASRWGVSERPGPGKTVWAECAMEAESQRDGTPRQL
jgi:anti-sigma regulatory factor (Ser/Thr protein kinase)